MMHIQIEITRLDYWKFNRFVMRKHLHWGSRRLIRWSGMLLIFSGLAWYAYHALGATLFWRSNIPIYLTIAVSLLALAEWYNQTSVKRRIMALPGEHNNVLGLHKIKISPEGILSKGSAQEERNRWEGVTEIDEDPETIYFFLDRMQAHIIPKRFFKSPTEESTFFNTAKHWWESAR